MTTLEMNQLRSQLHGTDARTALVRGASPPPRPPETVTVAPGLVATVDFDVRHTPLYVTAEAPSGRTVREYAGSDARAAADCAAELTARRDPEAVWLCSREQIRSWWNDDIVALLEHRLGRAARDADARLVVWVDEKDGAVEDRYDVVVDP